MTWEGSETLISGKQIGTKLKNWIYQVVRMDGISGLWSPVSGRATLGRGSGTYTTIFSTILWQRERERVGDLA